MHLLCIVFSEEKFIEPAVTLHQENVFVIMEHTPLQSRENGNKNRLCLKCAEFDCWESALLLLLLMRLKIKKYICYSFHLLKGIIASLYTIGKYFELKEYYPRKLGMGDVLLLFYQGYSVSRG